MRIGVSPDQVGLCSTHSNIALVSRGQVANRGYSGMEQCAVKRFASRAVGQAEISALNLAMCKIPLPLLNIQREIVAERALAEVIRKLSDIFQQKIQSKPGEIWGVGE